MTTIPRLSARDTRRVEERRIRRFLLSAAPVAIIVAIAATPFQAAADDITISTTVAGGDGENGNGKLGGTGGAAGMGTGQGGNGGAGGDGGAFNRGADGTSGTGGGAGGNIGRSGAANGGGGAGGAGTEIVNGVGGDGGGGGGGGGSGLVATDTNNITILSGGSINGGNGGNGHFQGHGQGAGGGGGDGITLTGSNGSLIENHAGAAITGGGGGNGNNTMDTGGGGGDGISIQGNDNVIINAGSISRGTGSVFASLPRDGNAISITGNNNRLELWATSTINGAVVANGTGNVFALGGSANGEFDMTTLGGQYQGFSNLKKTGTSTWTLTGDGSSFGGSTTVDDGVLRADSATAFAKSTDYVVNNGTLDLGGYDLVMSSLSGTGGTVAIGVASLTVDQAIDTSFAGSLSGSGTFVKDGDGVLTLSGDSSAFSGTTNLQAGTLVLNGVLGGSIEAYGDSVLNAVAADAISGFDMQTFYDNATLNAQAADAISGGTQEFWNTSTLNAKATDAIVGGMQTFNENSVLNASAVGAITDGTQTFYDDSVLNATAAGAISGGWQDFYGGSSLNASATDAIVYGSQSFDDSAKLNAGAGSIAGGEQGFWGDSELNAIGAQAIKAGQQSFRDASTLNASIANAIAGGTQEFFDDSTLNATAEDAISGGTQSFSNSSILNAGSGSIAGGGQSFEGRSVLNASAANAVNGGNQSFGGFTTLNATAASAISGGVQDFSWFATLNAEAGSIVGGEQTFRDASTLNVLATNALATTTDIRFENTGSAASSGTLKLNGFSTTIGRINSLNGVAGLITNDGATDSALSVNTSASASIFSGIIQNGSGTGKLGLTLTAGDLTLSGTNSYTGGTRVNGGRLKAGSATGFVSNSDYDVNGGTLDLGGFDLTMSSLSGAGGTVAVGAADLTVNQTVGTLFAGALSGTGSLTKSGTGILMLTGNSSAFSGMTTVAYGGTLVVGIAGSGALGGSMMIGSGALLGGTGTIGSTGSTLTIAAGAVHAPGNSIGIQTIAGDYFNHGTLRIEATPTAADRIVVAGSVDIAGAALDLVLTPTDASGWNVFNGPLTIIDKQSAGAIFGTFDPVTKNLLFLDTILDYAGGDGNDVTLQLVRNDIAFGQVGNTRNQIATGAAIDTLGNGNALWRAIALTNDPNVVRASFDALSGEIHASAKAALIEDSRFVRDAINDRIRAAFDGVGANGDTLMAYGNDGPQARAATADRFAVWGRAFGSWGHMDSDGNAARLSRSTGGFFFGVDAPVFDTWRFGAVAGFSHTSFNANARYSSASSDNYHLGLYGGTDWGSLAFRAGAAYTWHDISTNRTIVIPGVGDSLKSDYNAASAQAFGELGYKMQAGGVEFEPFANLAYVNFHTDGFTEDGGAAALSQASGSTDTTFATLGIRAATTFELGGANLTATGMVGWRNAFGDVTQGSTMRFASGGNAFSISGVPIARNSAVIEAGLDYAITPNATLGVSYNGQFGSGLSDQSARANFHVRF